MSQRLLKNKILTFYAIKLTLLPPLFPPDHGNKNFNKYDMTFFHVITFYLDSRKAVKNSAQKVVVISTSHCIRDWILGHKFNKSSLLLKILTQKSVKQWAFSWIAFCRTEKLGQKTRQKHESRCPKTSTKTPFKNSNFGCDPKTIAWVKSY